MKHVFITVDYKMGWNLIKSWSLTWNIYKVIYDLKKKKTSSGISI